MALNTREIATLIWGFILFVFLIRHNKTKSNLIDVIKSVIKVNLNSVGLIINGYIIIFIYFLYKSEISQFFPIKDYIIWIMMGLYPMVYYLAFNYKGIKLNQFYKKIFSFSIIPIFIVNEYTFKFITEMLLLPVILFLSMAASLAKTNKKYQEVETIINYLLGIFGLIIMIYSLKNLYFNLEDIKEFGFWGSLLFDFFVITLHLPLLYVIQYFLLYDEIIKKTDLYKRRVSYVFSMLCIFKTCYFNKYKLENLSIIITKEKRISNLSNFKDIIKLNT